MPTKSFSKAAAKEMASELLDELLSVLDDFNAKIDYGTENEVPLVIEALEEAFTRKIREYEL